MSPVHTKEISTYLQSQMPIFLFLAISTSPFLQLPPFLRSECLMPASYRPPPSPSLPPLRPLTLLLDFQYQVISLQGRVGCDMNSLNGPGHRGVDHGFHLHGREDTQGLSFLHLRGFCKHSSQIIENKSKAQINE